MSFVVPTSRFSRLLLDSMASPTTQSQGHRGDALAGPGWDSFLGPHSGGELSDASIDDDDDDDDEEETRTIVRSPATRIHYDISNLDRETQSEMRQLFQDTSPSDPPQMVLQWCQLNQEQRHGQSYAFQLTETVPRSVRIGSSNSRYARPKCNCMGDSEKPCRHLMYILDQLDYLTSNSLLDESVQKLGPQGYTAEMASPFERISKYHLDLLASNLHCEVGSPESNTQPGPVRLEETREILATIASSDGDEYAVKHYRPDVFDHHDSILKENGIISYDDLTSTVAKMLITNNDFFAYFLKLLEPNSIARDPFRKIQQHVDRVLGELDRYSRDPGGAQANSVEGPRDVPWAAAHITRAVCTIQYLLQKRADITSSAERASAARTLMRILHVIVLEWNRDLPQPAAPRTTNGGSASADASLRPPPMTTSSAGEPRPHSSHQNLYQTLIGSRTDKPTAFVLETLEQLPEQNQWIETLEEIELRLLDGTYGPPATFMEKLRDLISLMRSSRGSTSTSWGGTRGGTSDPGDTGGARGTGSKRSSGGGGSGRAEGPKRAR